MREDARPVVALKGIREVFTRSKLSRWNVIAWDLSSPRGEEKRRILQLVGRVIDDFLNPMRICVRELACVRVWNVERFYLKWLLYYRIRRRERGWNWREIYSFKIKFIKRLIWHRSFFTIFALNSASLNSLALPRWKAGEERMACNNNDKRSGRAQPGENRIRVDRWRAGNSHV